MERLDNHIIAVIVLTTLLLTAMAIILILVMVHHSRRLNEQVKARSKVWMQECDRVMTEIHRELYDNIVQMSHALSWKLEALQHSERDRAQGDKIRECKLLMKTLVAECVNVAGLLNSDFIRTKDLLTTLNELADHMSRYHHIQFDVKVVGDVKKLRPEDKLLVLRIAREAITNIRKHAHATKGMLILKYGPSSFVMIIHDNGLGLSGESSRQAMGLLNMRIRAEMLGGNFYMESAKGEGCTATVSVPNIKFAS